MGLQLNKLEDEIMTIPKGVDRTVVVLIVVGVIAIGFAIFAVILSVQQNQSMTQFKKDSKRLEVVFDQWKDQNYKELKRDSIARVKIQKQIDEISSITAINEALIQRNNKTILSLKPYYDKKIISVSNTPIDTTLRILRGNLSKKVER